MKNPKSGHPLALQWKTIPCNAAPVLLRLKKKSRLVSAQESNLTGMSGYEKSRHGYVDTHVGMICVDASRRPEIRVR